MITQPPNTPKDGDSIRCYRGSLRFKYGICVCRYANVEMARRIFLPTVKFPDDSCGMGARMVPSTNDLLVFSGNTQTATTNNYPANTPFNNITFNSGASAFTANGNQLVLSEPTDAGSGQIANGSINNLSANAETIRTPLLIVDGNHKIISSGGGVLRLNGSITRSNGTVVNMFGNIVVAGDLAHQREANGHSRWLGHLQQQLGDFLTRE